MAKLSLSRFPSAEGARAYYLSEVDKLAQDVTGAVSAVWHAKWEEVQEGGGPLLDAEAEALGVTVADVITNVTAARQKWRLAEASKEAERIKAKAAIRQATAPSEMCRALAAFRDMV